MSATVNSNFQDYDPRHRLTGAIVLILLAVIFLPMLLSKSPDVTNTGDEPVVMEITKDGNNVFVSRISAIPPETETRAESKQRQVESTEIKKDGVKA